MGSQYESHECEVRWCGLPYAQLFHMTRHILKQGMVALCGISLLCQQSMAVPMLSGNAVKQIHNSQVVAYHYDAWSRLTNRTLPNGVSTVYRYDEYGGVSNITYYQTPQQQKVITGFSYIYNQDGSIAKRSRINGLSEQAIEQYGYDDDNNLKDYQCSGALCPHDAQGKVITYQHYTFDGFNNIKTVASNNTLTTYEYDQQIPTRLIDYHNGNQAYPSIQKLRYDYNGNILQDDRGNVISYDPLDQTRSVSTHQGTTTYFYNGIGRQIGEVVPNQPTTYFIYGQNTLLNTRVGSQQTSFLYGANRLGKQDNKSRKYCLTDQGQSVVNTINQTEEQAENITSYAYSPYGTESDLTKQESNTITTQHFGFDGQLTDSQTNWQFLGQGYRAYNPMLHRFMSQDSMSPFDKGGINGYVFGSNNPIMMSDPSGHFSFSNLIPNTPAGWLGFGATMLAGGALAVALGSLLVAPISIEAGIALSAGIAGTSNAAGVYVEHGVATHSWIPNTETGKKMVAAFGVGVAMDMAVISVGTLLGASPTALAFGLQKVSAELNEALNGYRGYYPKGSLMKEFHIKAKAISIEIRGNNIFLADREAEIQNAIGQVLNSRGPEESYRAIESLVHIKKQGPFGVDDIMNHSELYFEFTRPPKDPNFDYVFSTFEKLLGRGLSGEAAYYYRLYHFLHAVSNRKPLPLVS